MAGTRDPTGGQNGKPTGGTAECTERLRRAAAAVQGETRVEAQDDGGGGWEVKIINGPQRDPSARQKRAQRVKL